MGGTGWPGDVDVGNGIAVATDGSVYTTGNFRATADFDPGAGTYNLTGFDNSQDAFVSKLDAAGNFVWAQQMGGQWTDFGYGIAVAADGTVYNTGSFASFSLAVDFDPYAGTFNLTSASGFDIFVRALSSDLDFGDAPDPTYPTLLASNGARHIVLPAIYLGGTVDTDLDGQPTALATGDDISGVDDEDGVTFTSVLATGEAATYDVVASVPGFLNAWIDFNDDGDWADAGEQIATDVALAAGLNSLGFSVPGTATVTGQAFARFRFDTGGGLSYDGPAPNGEVEDYTVEIIGVDYGDAPDPTYPTLRANNGARHQLGTGPFLGASVDADPDGQPNATATGDDADGNNDDGGVVFGGPLIWGHTTTITVTASAPGLLDAWIDVNQDGSWTATEQFAFSSSLLAGPNVLNLTVPVSAALGTTYTRFRFSTAGGLSPDGLATDGEVEDYEVEIRELDFGDAPDPTYPTLFASNGARHAIVPGMFLGASVDTELDGLPSLQANADDVLATDDEDGVTFTSLLIAGQTATYDVTASATGLLNAWVDFNDDGDWADAGEQIATDAALGVGINPLNFTVPLAAVPTSMTFARFRFDTTGGLSYDGFASDGEIEDYGVEIYALDFGDAPDPSYPTLLANDGARHIIVAGFFLGTGVDNEPDGQPDATATGDDTDAGGNDDDGVVLVGGLYQDHTTAITVTASATGLLDAWIDLNQDGDWLDAGEQFFASLPLVAGANNLTVTIPADATLGNTFVRFRFSTAGGLAPTGLADDGKVEDYEVTIQQAAGTIGLFVPTSSMFFLNNANEGGAADLMYGYGLPAAGWLPITGDWNGDGDDTIGLFDPVSSMFFLNNSHQGGAADLMFGYGPPGAGWLPIAGDWDGDGEDTIGLFDPVSSMFFLNNTNQGGAADVMFGYGPPGAGWLPIAGDWNGDGDDTIGLFAPTSSMFFLNNTNQGGAADLMFGYGPPGAGWQPITGDWNEDNIDTIGLFAPTSSTFFLNNTNQGGVADSTFAYGPPGAGWLPIAGDWNGSLTPLLAAGGVVSLAENVVPLTQADLGQIVTEAIADWAGVGLATEQIESLLAVDFIVTDLPGAQIGLAALDTVYLDLDAAGHGWFVDLTPGADEEFRATGDGNLAIDPAVVDRMDLLTVVSHELGHTLGFADLGASSGSLMSGTLETGLRQEPGMAEIDGLFARL